jgi:hypothetical protein
MGYPEFILFSGIEPLLRIIQNTFRRQISPERLCRCFTFIEIETHMGIKDIFSENELVD